MRLLVGGLLVLLALPPCLRAQDSVIVIDPDLPPGDSAVVRAGPAPDIVAELLRLLQRLHDHPDAGRRELSRRQRVHRPAGAVPRLAASGRPGPGRRGVINATLYLLPGADVEGDVLVVGGRLIRSPGARHEGRERVLWDAVPVMRSPEGTLVVRERRRTLGELASARTTFQTGRVRTTLLLATGGTYDRIEGLPIVFGPTFELRPSQSTVARLDLRGILRTAGEGARLSSEFGYGIRAELRFPAGGIAGRLYSEVAPFEDQPLSPSENGWSAFLLQRDYRDYFERRGGGGAAWVNPTRTLRFEVSLRRDRERSLRATDPWSLFRNSDRWRRNPLSDDGHYFTTGLQLDLDTRNEREAAEHRLAAPGPVRALDQRRRRAGHAAGDGASADTHGRRVRLRPAAAGSPALLAADAFAAREHPAPRRRLDRRRPAARPAARLARRARPAARIRVPQLHLRPARVRRPVGARAVRPLHRGTGRGPDAARAQPRLSVARSRGRSRVASSGSRRRIWSSSRTRARHGSPATALGRSR